MWLYGDDFAWADSNYTYGEMGKFKEYFNQQDETYELSYKIASDYFKKLNFADNRHYK